MQLRVVIEAPVRILLKILFTGLLLLLLVALGTEVVALHRASAPEPPYPTAPVLVRKAVGPAAPFKTVRPALKK